jgi:cardiolipin synthase (CMP-forming)
VANYQARDALGLPSIISWIRVPLAAAFPAVVDRPPAAMAILIAAAASDVLDGWVARRFGLVTPMGAVVDPITDKLFVFSVVGALTWAEKLPPWALALLATREIAEAPLVIWYATSRRMRRARVETPMANIPGKVATGFQFATVALAIMGSKHTRALVYATAVAGAVAAASYLARALAARARASRD